MTRLKVIRPYESFSEFFQSTLGWLFTFLRVSLAFVIGVLVANYATGFGRGLGFTILGICLVYMIMIPIQYLIYRLIHLIPFLQATEIVHRILVLEEK